MDSFRVDLRRFFKGEKKISRKTKALVLSPCIWAIAVYRIGSWLHKRKQNCFFCRLSLPFVTILQLVVTIITGIELPFTAKIGKGLYIGHFGGIVISYKAVLGDCCNLSPGVVIGQAGRGGKQFVPIIGDRVFIGSGAKLFGKIVIGNDVAIGANAVVTIDLPDNSVAVGVPAKLINLNGSADFIH